MKLKVFLIIFSVLAVIFSYFFVPRLYAGFLCGQDSNCDVDQQCKWPLCIACTDVSGNPSGQGGLITSECAQDWMIPTWATNKSQYCTWKWYSGQHCQGYWNCQCQSPGNSYCSPQSQCGSSADCGAGKYCNWSTCGCQPIPTTCSSVGGDCNRLGHSCPVGTTIASNSYDCNEVCCVPSAGSCGDGACNNGESCSSCGVDCCNGTPPGGGGGGGGSCTNVIDQSYYECTSDPNFGACGYLVTQFGGPVWHQVTHGTCTGWDCHADTVTSCQSTIGGHVWIDNNRDKQQNNGETNVNASTQTTLTISGNNTTYTVKTDANGNFNLNPSGNALIGSVYTVKIITIPQNYLISVGQQSVTVNTSNRYPNNVNLAIYPDVYNVSGHVFIDKNENGAWDAGELAATSAVGTVTLSDGAGQTATMNADGSYTMTNVWNNNSYNISATVPAGYTAPNVINVNVNSADVTGADIGIIPYYGISGEVFKDTYKDFTNGNSCYEQGADTLYTDTTTTVVFSQNGVTKKTIKTNTGTFNTNDANGKATLPSGTYNVGFSSTLPAGYEIKTPSVYTVTIGPSCNAGNALAYCDAITSPPAPSVPLQPSCDASRNVKNISFGLNNENPFFQIFCQDYSSDKGVDDPLPPVGTTCGTVPSGYLSYIQASCNIAGIVFYNGSYNFGQGQANPNNTLVSRAYTPLNADVNQMAYTFVEQTLKSRGISATDLSGTDPITGNPYCTTSTGTAGLADCKLEANLPSGIYQIGQTDTDTKNEDLTITASPTFAADTTNPKTYIFLISGNLNINKNILVPNGAAVAFVAQNGIKVDANVGEQNATSMNPDLEGIYVAGTDFTIDTLAATGAICKVDGTNLDKKLNIIGYIIPGAEGTGTIINRRDLCSYDTTCPVQTVGTGDTGLGNTYLLNISNALKLRTNYQQEAAPGPATPTP